MRRLKRPCIEFGVVRIDSAIVVCIHSAIIQLLLSRRVNKNGWRRHSIWILYNPSLSIGQQGRQRHARMMRRVMHQDRWTDRQTDTIPDAEGLWTPCSLIARSNIQPRRRRGKSERRYFHNLQMKPWTFRSWNVSIPFVEPNKRPTRVVNLLHYMGQWQFEKNPILFALHLWKKFLPSTLEDFL